MAATHYSLSVSTYLALFTDLAAALNAKGLITSILYQDNTNGYFIFSTPLSTKVFKLYLGSSGQMGRYTTFSYGDAWTSGTTITNEVTLLNYAGAAGLVNSITAIHVVADTTYYAMVLCRGAYTSNDITYVGALDNGDVIAFGYETIATTVGLCRNITDGADMTPIGLSAISAAKDGSGNFLSMPLMWVKTDGTMEFNGSSPAKTLGLKIATINSTGNLGTGVIVAATYLVTQSVWFRTAGQCLFTGLLMEYT